MIILTYVDDCILISEKKETLDQFIHSLANGIKNFEFTDEGAIDKYLGVEIDQLKGEEFILRQPFLIQIILAAINVKTGDYNQRDVPVIGTLLSRDDIGAKQKHDWRYRSAIGMLRQCGLCRRLVIWRSYQLRVRPVKNGLCDNVCRMSPDMVQQATNGNSFDHNRI